MVLSERVSEVKALAERLWFLPAPARAPLADKLHGLGVRVHPELATLRLERDGPKYLGNHAPQRVVKIDNETGLKFLRSTGDPDLSDLADRIENANTEQDRARERDRLKDRIPDDLKLIEDKLGSVRAEDLE